MSIIERAMVRHAYDRALQLDPQAGAEAAILAAAQALGMDVEIVREVMAPVGEVSGC